MPKVTPGEDQAVEETIVTRLIPARSKENDRGATDAIEYMESMPRDKWEEKNHIVYLYRVEPAVYRNAPGPTYVTKYSSPITLDQIQQEYGGGLWRIVIKRANERVSDSRYQLSGTPRDLTRTQQEFSPNSQNGVPAQMDTNAGITPGGVVSKAMDMVGNTEAQRAQVEMVKSTATDMVHMVREAMPKQMSLQEIIVLAKELAPKANAFLESPLGIALAGKLLDRLFADPTEQFVKIAEIMTRLKGGSTDGDWKSALVSAAPQIANAVKDTVQELRLGTEAQMRLNADRTLTAVPPPASVTQAPPTQPNLGGANVVQMPPPAQSGPPVMEEFESELVKLLNDPNITGDMAGEILDQRWPRIVDEIATYSVDQILSAFSIRPILQPHAQNPRLRQFVTEFWEWARDTEPPLTPPAPAS